MGVKTYCVYSHTNKINGKIYIGLTSMKPEERWKNGVGYHAGTHFRNAIDKYGWYNFEHRIIKDGLTENEASYWEQYYIAFYNSTDKQYGYNMSSGGESGGHPQTEETKKKISEHSVGFSGKKHSKESIEKMRAVKGGENHPNYGKHLSDETKRKISDAHKKLRNKRVYCEELDCIFESLDEAAEKIGRTKSAIVYCCKGKTKTCKGYHLKYID